MIGAFSKNAPIRGDFLGLLVDEKWRVLEKSEEGCVIWEPVKLDVETD